MKGFTRIMHFIGNIRLSEVFPYTCSIRLARVDVYFDRLISHRIIAKIRMRLTRIMKEFML